MINLSKSIIAKRVFIQVVIGFSIYFMITWLQLSLWFLLIPGVVTGLIFGKVFCRWMCPMGFIMEIMMGGGSDATQRQLYNYHKLGCPIAWITGFLNRSSLFRIRRDPSICIDCGICDTKCYISTLNDDYSLFKEDMKDPAIHFSCSKCLACVESCPAKSLTYKI